MSTYIIIGIVIAILLVLFWPEKIESRNFIPIEPEVKCHVCKHKVDKADAQKVECYEYDMYHLSGIFYRWYCNMHTVHYNRYQKFNDHTDHYFKIIPAREEEVNEDGSVIKEIKKVKPHAER